MAQNFERFDAGRINAWSKDVTGMLNDEKKLVDAYIPRKCEATGKIIHANDRASVQIAIADVDESTGKATSGRNTVILSGFVRSKGYGAYALDKVLKEKGILPISE